MFLLAAIYKEKFGKNHKSANYGEKSFIE